MSAAVGFQRRQGVVRELSGRAKHSSLTGQRGGLGSGLGASKSVDGALGGLTHTGLRQRGRRHCGRRHNGCRHRLSRHEGRRHRLHTHEGSVCALPTQAGGPVWGPHTGPCVAQALRAHAKRQKRTLPSSALLCVCTRLAPPCFTALRYTKTLTSRLDNGAFVASTVHFKATFTAKQVVTLIA
eukprot:359189-Chlamydomonas_euryale.AAC.3